VGVEEYQVISVEKAFRLTPWEHVTHIYYRGPDGTPRRMTYFDAIRAVEENTAHFYVVREGNRIALELAHNALGYRCLRASEGNVKDILLTVPDDREPG